MAIETELKDKLEKKLLENIDELKELKLDHQKIKKEWNAKDTKEFLYGFFAVKIQAAVMDYFQELSGKTPTDEEIMEIKSMILSHGDEIRDALSR